MHPAHSQLKRLSGEIPNQNNYKHSAPSFLHWGTDSAVFEISKVDLPGQLPTAMFQIVALGKLKPSNFGEQ